MIRVVLGNDYSLQAMSDGSVDEFIHVIPMHVSPFDSEATVHAL